MRRDLQLKHPARDFLLPMRPLRLLTARKFASADARQSVLLKECINGAGAVNCKDPSSQSYVAIGKVSVETKVEVCSLHNKLRADKVPRYLGGIGSHRRALQRIQHMFVSHSRSCFH